MEERGNSASQAILDGLCARLGVGIVYCDRDDTIVWSNDQVQADFPSLFPVGENFTRIFERITSAERTRPKGSFRGQKALLERVIAPGEVRRLEQGGRSEYYRHLRFALGDGRSASSAPRRVHCLVNITGEKQLEQTFLSNLHQLTSMKDIIDLLYESLSTQEVLYLILVALTAHVGFGFNRAFYLEACAGRLRGRIGIGPSSNEDAHRIWSRLARLNLPTLRALYEDLTRNGEPPDPETQALAARMDFPISAGSHGLMGAIERRQPTLIRSGGAPDSEAEAELFHLLSADQVAVVPLYVRNSLAAVLVADNFITRKPITDHDLNVLKTFSGYAGVALERSQLYDELRESIEKLKSANQTLKDHQQKLLQAEKLSAIGELAACVSHEIRNPLVAIGGLARSLLKDKSLTAENQEALELVAVEVSRLEKFLRETLDFAKPDVLGARTMDVRPIVEQCLVPFRREMEESAIELDLDLTREPLPCSLEPDLFRRALSNLVRNAVEALGEGGTIRVSAYREGLSARIEVADTGGGFPPELKARAFEPFFTTKPEGTGLGLALASQNIRKIGGQISLQENEHFKSILLITLPLDSAPGAAGNREEEKEEVLS